MGECRRLRGIAFSERRWPPSFKHVALHPSERKPLWSAIGALRIAEHLPLPGDSGVACLPIAELVFSRHDIPGTSLQLIYDWTDTTLLLVVLKRRR